MLLSQGGGGGRTSRTSVRGTVYVVSASPLRFPGHIRRVFAVLQADALRRTLVALDVPKVLVFMNEARRLKDALFRLTAITSAFDVAILHSEMPKDARRSSISAFLRGEVRPVNHPPDNSNRHTYSAFMAAPPPRPGERKKGSIRLSSWWTALLSLRRPDCRSASPTCLSPPPPPLPKSAADFRRFR